MTNPAVRLAGLGPGVIQDVNGHALASRPINVYLRDTSTPITVYSDEALTLALAQPLLSDAGGSVPGFVASGQSIDFYDTVSGNRIQVEAVAGTGVEQTANKGQPNGYASLDSGGKLSSGQIPSSVVSVSSPSANQSPVFDGSVWTAVEQMRAERTSTPYTLFVDAVNGNDANDGKSPGSAVASIVQAALLLQQANQRGQITFMSGGTVNINQPVHFSQGAVIRCLGQGILILQRNFDTPNGRTVWDAVTTASGTSVTSATAAFTSSDVNRIVMIYGCGVQGGTFYDFITAETATTASFTAATSIARSSTTDPWGVKMSVVGDWNRVVTDAAITSGQSVVTSATAAWTNADINTELVIAGAGHNGQALRSVIESISGNTATIAGVASNTVSGKRCAIGVNFGDLFVSHGGGFGMRGAVIQDVSSGANRIGAAIKLMVDEGASGNSDDWLEHVRITSTDASGAWEAELDLDGSWQQTSGGPGIRRVTVEGVYFFGARRPAETIRINSGVHVYFWGGGIFAAPTAIQQGVTILDPRATGGDGTNQCADIHFAGFEAEADLYAESQFSSFMGGRLGSGASSVNTVKLGATSNWWVIDCGNGGGSNFPDMAGTNALVKLGNVVYMKRDGAGTSYQKWFAAAQQGVSSTLGVGAFLALTGSQMTFGSSNAGPVVLESNSLQCVKLTTAQSVLAGKGTVTTTATDGFLYIPTVAGAPTGTPTAQTGFAPIVFDTTNNKIWIYTGAWKGVVVA